jgi:hypothetical protein
MISAMTIITVIATLALFALLGRLLVGYVRHDMFLGPPPRSTSLFPR